MTESKQLTTTASIGDVAVDGLLAGLAAGVGMGLYWLVVGMILGISISETLSRLAPGQTVNPLLGTLAHLAVAAVYGMLFELARRHIPGLTGVASWLLGLLYGVLLLLLARTVLAGLPDAAFSQISPFHVALAHGVYGLVLGAMAGRRRSEA